MTRIEGIMRTSPVIPVIVASGQLDPVAIAEAFVRGGRTTKSEFRFFNSYLMAGLLPCS